MEVTRKILAAFLAFALCGAPQLLHAAQQQTPPAQAGSETQAPAPSASESTTPTSATPAPDATAPENPEPQQSQTGVTVDPAQGPLQPVPSHEDQEQTAAPATTAPVTPVQNAQSSTAQKAAPEAPQPQVEPQGTAAAQKGRTVGGVASQPAGTAIAPAKQRQVRSWLIRLGVIAAAGVAAGTVYGLSRKTPSLPPGTTTHTAASH